MILNVLGISFAYGDVGILHDITFTVGPGDVISILGPNGSGKSTLLRCIDGILHPDSGRIDIDGEMISDLTRKQLSERVGYVPQRAEPHRMTVFESILLGRRPHINMDASDKDIAITNNVLKLFGLEGISMKYADEISGGELQMVQVARTVAQHPETMVLDEPTNNLDLANQQSILSNLRGIVKSNSMSAIMVQHDLNLALRHSDKFILMKDGHIHTAGGQEIITPENIREVYGMDVYVEKVHGITVVVPRPNDDTGDLEDFLSRRKRNPKQRQFFNERAEIWDEISVHDGSKVEYITSLLELKGNENILDVGTGTGVTIPYYMGCITDGHVTAIDFSEKMIEIARSKYPESGSLSYRVDDIYQLENRDEFDAVVCYSCFPHFPDPVGAIRVLSDSLKKGGKLCIAHSSSKEHINHVHASGGEEICTDYLPEMDIMCKMYSMNGLRVTFTRDDHDYYIVIGVKE